MKPISEQTYNNIVSLLDHNLSLRQIATQLGISKTTVSKVRDEARPDKERVKVEGQQKLQQLINVN